MAEIHEEIFDVLCCIVVADGKATSGEKEKLVELMKKTGSGWGTKKVADQLATFITRIRVDSYENVVEKSLVSVPKFKEIGREDVLLRCVDLIAEADGTLDDREAKLIAEIRSRLE